MTILICGGRGFSDWRLFLEVMQHVWMTRGVPTAFISGGARGADTFAWKYAMHCRLPFRAFRADWLAHGRAAGFLRNQKMLDYGKPDLVVAFPGGAGTADMIRRARKAGVPVFDVSKDWPPTRETLHT